MAALKLPPAAIIVPKSNRPGRGGDPVAPTYSQRPADYAPDKVLRIAGFPAVAALFKRAPERVLRLFYEDPMVPKVGPFCAELARARKPYRLVDSVELERVAGTVHHGGIVAVAEPLDLPAFSLDEARTWARAGQPLFILDGIGNPHNLGAIARSLAFFGYRHLVISDHPAQAGLSDSAYRVAEGGLDHLGIYRATHLPATLKRLTKDFRIVGTALGKGVPLEALREDPRPVALIFGNEEDGLSPATLEVCESIVTLRGAGAVQSLNVSATAAIFAYALRPKSERPTPRPTLGAKAPSKPTGKKRPT